jgi:membrane protein DedA with SNARE-associated domain
MDRDAAALLTTWGYPAYLVLFLASAIGSPITEDLLLLVGGYLIGAGVFTWPITAGIAGAGVVAADSILYGFGRTLRHQSGRRGLVRRIVRPGRLRVATRWFARFGDRIVFLARLTPGTRIVVFVSAGLRGVSFWRFLLFDALAAALWVPALLWIGAAVGERVGGIQEVLHWIGSRILWVVLTVAALVAVRQVWLSRTAGTADDAGR